MLRNEKLFPTLSSLYLHDNQSSHLIPHAEKSLPSVLHPEIIDKPYPPSNQKKRKNRERLSSEKRKKKARFKNPRHPGRVLLGSWRSSQIKPSKPGQPLGQAFVLVFVFVSHVLHTRGAEIPARERGRARNRGSSERDDNSGGVGARDGEELEFLVARSPIARRWGRRAQCYDGQQADKSQPVPPVQRFLSRSRRPVHPSIRPSVRPFVHPGWGARACVRACTGRKARVSVNRG